MFFQLVFHTILHKLYEASVRDDFVLWFIPAGQSGSFSSKVPLMVKSPQFPAISCQYSETNSVVANIFCRGF